MTLAIAVLGSFEVTAAGEVVRLTGQRRISLLARLAMDAGRVVAGEQLVADLWGDSGTATAAKQLHIVVSKVRELLAPYHEGDLITTVPGGYRLELPRERVDAHQFVSLVRQARETPDPAVADGLFRQALALWRGPALTGVAGAWAVVESARLEEERLNAVDDHIDLRLASGEQQAVVPELAAHIRTAPLRERPRAQLMLALYRSSRPSEALEVYQDTRRVLAEELGIEPGSALRRLHHAVLNQDPTLDLTPPLFDLGPRRRTQAIVPAELPADTRAFTGRTGELAWLHRMLDDRVPDDPVPGDPVPGGPVPGGPVLAVTGDPVLAAGSGPVVAAIDGPGGMGKSALAVRAAHAVVGRYTDGVLYVDLRAATPGLHPMEATEALRRMLRSLGLSGAAVPADLGELAARYRSLTATRNLLIVLDNAVDARQVRPLLPAGPGCAVIITSRQAMTSLDVSGRLHLAGLSDGDGIALLAHVAGAGRVAAETEAAQQIVRHCDGLPLALRIAAARLAARPGWKAADLATELADATRRLDALQHDDLAIRSCIAVGRAHLEADPDTLFPLLGLLESKSCSAAVAAALTGWPESRAETALESLHAARLVEQAGPERYRLHDLIRLHAREQAGELSPQVSGHAVRQALRHYAAAIDTAFRLTDPEGYSSTAGTLDLPEVGLSTMKEANEWIRAERDNLLPVARQAVTEAPGFVATLTNSIAWVFWRKGWLSELIEVCEGALELAEGRDDWQAQARLHVDLASVHSEQGRHNEAVAHLKRALACWDTAGQPLRKAGALNDLGHALTLLGDYDGALAAQGESLAITRQTGRRDHEAMVRNNRVHVYHRQGRFVEAVEEARACLAMWDAPRGSGVATAYDTLGDAYRAAGRLTEAEDAYRMAVELQGEAGMDFGNAQSCWWLGRVLHDLGRGAEARQWWRRSLDLLVTARLHTPEEAERLLEQDDPVPPAAVRGHL